MGRAGEADEVAGLLDEFRLVTVTGPGGVGKTRLAVEVARRVVSRFADGAWLAELGSVQDAALVPTAVARALGVRLLPGISPLEALVQPLARRQLLLVMDNCEHVLAAVADLCGALSLAADDVRVLATSREPIGIAGEARYRLAPLSLPGRGRRSARWRSRRRWRSSLSTARDQMDPHFTLDGEAGPLVPRLVTRLGLDAAGDRAGRAARGWRRWGRLSCWSGWMTGSGCW